MKGKKRVKILSTILALTLLVALMLPIAGTLATETEQLAQTVTVEPPKVEVAKEELPKPEAPKEEPSQEAQSEAMPIETVQESAQTEQTEIAEETETVTESETSEETEASADAEAPEVTEVPVEPENPEEFIEPEVTEEPEIAELKASLSDISLYAFAGDDVHATLTVEGGAAPYTVQLGDEEIMLEAAGSVELHTAAKEGGMLQLTVVVTDAQGTAVEATCNIPIAVDDKGDANAWIEKAKNLNGMLTTDWHNDIVMIAESQLGYEESTINFIIRKRDNKRQGYTVYGDLYGEAYEEWCAMFASFCVEYANIPSGYFPQNSSCSGWIDDMKDLGAYEDDENDYNPKPGDLIFFSQNDTEHVGIVESVSGGSVYAVEGISGHGVCRNAYAMGDPCIIGYANIDKLMVRAGLIKEELEEHVDEAPAGEVTDESSEEVMDELQDESMVGATAKVIVDWANLRTQPSTDDIIAPVITSLPMDEEMQIVGKCTCDDGIWYQMRIGDITGWMRGDLVAVLEEAVQDENAPEPERDEHALQVAAWVEEVGASEEMIARALNAKTLDSLVLEGGELIYVRTGEVIAIFDAESGMLFDVENAIPVARLDIENGMIYPLYFEE